MTMVKFVGAISPLVVLLMSVGAICVCHAAEDPAPDLPVCDRSLRCDTIREGLDVYCIKLIHPTNPNWSQVFPADTKCMYTARYCNDGLQQEPIICHPGKCTCDDEYTCGPGIAEPRPPQRSHRRPRRNRWWQYESY